MQGSSGPRQAFVTGGTGFTGGHLCRALVHRGWQVSALVRSGSRVEALRSAGARLVEGDVRDRRSFDGSLDGAQVVFHIAAAFREARLSDADYTAVNVEGTRNVIAAAARSGVARVVHCSTVGVHGDTGPEAVDEDAPFSPPDFYCKSKLAGELLARELFEKHRIEGVVFRPVGIHGPGDTRFLKLFRSLRRGRFVMIGSGNVRYHLTYIDDLVDGILRCADRPEAVGEVFFLGGGSIPTLNEMIDEVVRAVSGKPPRLRIPMAPVMAAAVVCERVCRPLRIEPPLYPRRVEFFSKHRAFDISRARRLLGFAPTISMREGFARTAEWYAASSLL